MSNVIQVDFPNNFKFQVTIADLSEDIFAYCGNEYGQLSLERGFCNEDFEPICYQHYMFCCEYAMDFLHCSGLYDDDTIDRLSNELERLRMWWETQGKRMWTNQHYVTEA